MRFDLTDLPPELAEFMSERRVGSLTLVGPDGSPHVTPVGITWDPASHKIRIITWAEAYKAKLLSRNPSLPAAACEVVGGRWLTFYGQAQLVTSADQVAEAVQRYTKRYKPPKQRHDRVAIEIDVDRIIGRV